MFIPCNSPKRKTVCHLSLLMRKLRPIEAKELTPGRSPRGGRARPCIHDHLTPELMCTLVQTPCHLVFQSKEQRLKLGSCSMLKIPLKDEWGELPQPGPATGGRLYGEERRKNGVGCLQRAQRPSLSRSGRHMAHHGERPFTGSHRNALGRNPGCVGVRNLLVTSTGTGRAYAPAQT